MESALRQTLKKRRNTIDWPPSRDTMVGGTITSSGSRIKRLVDIACHWTNFAISDRSLV
jgi:hypothetical protein